MTMGLITILNFGIVFSVVYDYCNLLNDSVLRQCWAESLALHPFLCCACVSTPVTRIASSKHFHVHHLSHIQIQCALDLKVSISDFLIEASFTVSACPQVETECVEPYNTVLCAHSSSLS